MTKDEIKDAVAKLFDAEDWLVGVSSMYSGRNGMEIQVQVEREAAHITMSLSKLKRLADIFGTDDIDIRHSAFYDHSDNVSGHVVRFTARNVAITLEA